MGGGEKADLIGGQGGGKKGKDTTAGICLWGDVLGGEGRRRVRTQTSPWD